MPKTIINDVRTKPIGFAPILAHYFKKCGIVDIIDAHVQADPRRNVLTHGQACIAMITGILFQVMQLYRICQFARESTVFDALLPGIDPEEYFDDRLADTLVVLIERSARRNIEARNKGLDDFMPNQKDYRKPKAEYLLQKFEHIVAGTMRLPGGKDYGFVSELTPLQADILKILDVPKHCYSYDYLFTSL